MIINEFVKIKIGGKNIKHFKKLYNDIKLYQEITVPINQLTEGSNIKIDCVCDKCGKSRNITYQKYKESEKSYGKYTCHKCSHEKRKETNINKYNVENYLESDEFKEKSLKTIKNKYDCSNVFQSGVIKEKIKNDYIIKYGVEHISQTEHFKEKFKKTCLERYDTDYYIKTKDFIEKSNKTKLKKYGNENYVNVDKMLETRIKNGSLIPKNELTDWQLYKRTTLRLTHRNKKKLLNLWDGYDYYDGEYIKDNYTLYNRYNKNYPNIDHKISIYEGFKNSITPLVLSNLDNLCITKKKINSAKMTKTEKDFSSSLL